MSRTAGYVLLVVGLLMVAGAIITLGNFGGSTDIGLSGRIEIGLSYAVLGVVLSVIGFVLARRRAT